MKIYVVGSSKNKFLPLDNIREKFLVDVKHDIPNIDFLNPWYCELTGLYYLWQHVDDDIVGLEHYRTYFWKNGHLINEAQIKEELKKGDIICSGYAYPAFGRQNLLQELEAQTHGTVKHFLYTLEQHDKGFAEYFKKYLFGQKLWCCNIFIGPKKIFNEWMEFFFDVILDFEQMCPIGPTRKNTARREGYFAEFAFGAWLEYKGYKIVHCDGMKYRKDLRNKELYFAGPDKQIR